MGDTREVATGINDRKYVLLKEIHGKYMVLLRL
jgi:hypothetical protein